MDLKEFPRNYEPGVVDVLKAMSLTGDGKDIRVIGSASLRRIQYAGDYDANVVTHMHISQVAKALGDVVKRLKQIPLLVIGDIKVGEKAGEPFRWTAAEVERGYKGELSLEKAMRTGGMVKIDTIALVHGGRYVEIGCVYRYGFEAKPLTTKEALSELKDSLKEELKDKNYWKALKRMFSIARLVGDKGRVDRLTEQFNSDLGRLYSVISDITVLEYLIENKEGDTSVMADEIGGFKSRLATIWTLPEFIKAEPAFDDILDKAAEAPREALRLLRRLKERFTTILQEEASRILHLEGTVKR
jgi:hypothetical protein